MLSCRGYCNFPSRAGRAAERPPQNLVEFSTAAQRLMAPAHSHDHYEETVYGIDGSD